MLTIEINNDQPSLTVDRTACARRSKTCSPRPESSRAEISVAIVDDPTIHRLNKDFLDHDYPTDVLSFVLERSGDTAWRARSSPSADTAIRNAAQYGWPPADELLLYIIHGALHLAGFDDTSDQAAAAMRVAEREHLGRFGVSPRY